MAFGRTRSKSDAIVEYFMRATEGDKASRRRYLGIVIAVVVLMIAIALVATGGGFAAGGYFLSGLFAAAFIIALYNVVNLFGGLVEDRDARRFVQERIVNRTEEAKKTAFSDISEEEMESDSDNIFCLSGYTPDSVDGHAPLFAADEREFAHSSNYEATVFKMGDAGMEWCQRRFRLDVPDVSFEDTRGEIRYDMIATVEQKDIPFTYRQKGTDKNGSYPYLFIGVKNGAPLSVSIASSDLIDESFDTNMRRRAGRLITLAEERRAKAESAS